MSDNKKYYYLKLKDNFFDSDELIILESMPDGYVYSNILLKLYLRSLRNEGKLMFNDRIPFNATMLSQLTRHSVGDIEKAIQIFNDLGLIEIMDNGAIYMMDIQNFIGESSTEADRVRAYRARIANEKANVQKLEQKSYKCTDKSTPEKEKEIDINKEIEKEKPSKQALIESDFNEIWKFYPKKISKKEGLAAYKRAIKKGVTKEEILDGLKRYNEHLKANKDWLKPMDGGRWFQKERWTDEYETTKGSGGRDTTEYDNFF
ncbi:phage replisome organizer N-terminal domain-containing protein (plasmid) [Vagococcus lutrae]|uniref:Phage replisome organizer N-terminal domain-containing protein n=1 Tax=Vagococcus lutrae TaxID=81947 RepID=A0AAE9XGM5_9ENTE|nr:phage replisome organizer N-terminal domain-containing protein [Vagococcus lutrae]MDO5742344.1 phage replisome organizer N-terminal domain-containing protein [Vagococcus sp.]UQF24238.1 phage replisome organizer N-terminal domain-containing protein [Vagococcus lutrae]UQF37775.1 phage replisome organizer N-terminal domain-containing protein [Vagococcus lutrae]UQF63672.1 phage replisome organizer N-terminal domain-containing protein [Vagococcus lutrae]WCG23698.1 phage replisome organizer N-ter